MPICCAHPNESYLVHISAILPFTMWPTKRPHITTRLPVGGIPPNAFLKVKLSVKRVATLCPSPITSLRVQ